ncbi:MAG: NAD-binding protein, partial [Vicinamibacteria bacterium]|nr:NAD-binding protein [Vicinamibacteria bacterium]
MTEAAGPERQPHVILCGLGHVGMRVLNLLVRLGENVHVITDRTRDEWRAAVERHASLIVGDARDERALRQAGIEQARAIVVATDNDLTNTSIAIDAKRINPSITVVMRLFDQQLAQSIESALGLRMALSASALAAPAFAAAAMGERSLGSFTLNDSLFVIEEHVIDAGRSVGACQPAHATAPAAVLRSGQIVAAAKPSAEMRQGDTLIALTEARAPRNREVAAMRPRDISDRLRGAAGGLRKTMVQISRPLRRALATLIAIVFASVIVFHFGLQL